MQALHKQQQIDGMRFVNMLPVDPDLQVQSGLRNGPSNSKTLFILIRPCEVLSRVANVTILEVANNALRVLLQHRHVIIGSLA